MKKLFSKFISKFLFLFLVFSLFIGVNISAEKDLGYVTISIEDNVERHPDDVNGLDEEYKEPFGTIIEETQVPITHEGMLISEVTEIVLADHGFEADIAKGYGWYLAAIGPVTSEDGSRTVDWLSEFDSGSQSGWMITLNDWFINQGANNFVVKDGDVVRWLYTASGLGADLGNDWNSQSDGFLKTITPNQGVFDKRFSKDVLDYTLYLKSGTQDILILPTAQNKANFVSIISNENRYRRTDKITVQENQEISLITEQPPQINLGEEDEGEPNTPLKTYTIKINFVENDELVSKLIQQIESLPSVDVVSKDDKTAIDFVENQYNNLDDQAKSQVTNYSKIEDLKNRIEEIETGINKAVKMVEDLIDALPEANDVKIEDKQAIEEAQSEYDKLSESNQGKVKNKDELDKVQKALAIMEEIARIEELLQLLPEAIEDIKLDHKQNIVELEKLWSDAFSATFEHFKNEEDKIEEYIALLPEVEKLEKSIDDLPEPDKLTKDDKDEVEEISKKYADSKTEVKNLVSVDLLDKLEKLEEKINLRTYKHVEKSNTTYSYKLNDKYTYDLYRKIEKTSTKTTTRNYRTTGSKKISSKDIITKKGSKIVQKAYYKYDTKGKQTSYKLQKLNSKKKFVTTYYNTKTYYSNGKTKQSTKYYRSLTTGKYTSKNKTKYTSKGYKNSYVKFSYKSGKKSKRYEYKYNSRGQSKTNKYGKSYRYYTSYSSKGKSIKTTKRNYTSKGKLSSKSIKVNLRTSF